MRDIVVGYAHGDAEPQYNISPGVKRLVVGSRAIPGLCVLVLVGRCALGLVG